MWAHAQIIQEEEEEEAASPPPPLSHFCSVATAGISGVAAGACLRQGNGGPNLPPFSPNNRGNQSRGVLVAFCVLFPA